MAFLRKRSGSQCSFTEGEDEITVRRIEQTDLTRKARSDTIQSARSSCSSVDISDFAIHDSCVMRNFPKHKSSHLRFLAWVAYVRKYTDEYITEDERRTCPLLWCREVFANQEAMLQHVWNCPNLSKGLYWCFHCQKPERVGKFNCKRCQGAPSRTDRMTSVAKKIFSKLGAKPHRSDHNTNSSSSDSPQNSSKSFEQSETPVPPYFQDPLMSWSHSSTQELPNSSLIPEMAGDWTAASHELPDTCISEMAGTECPIELAGGIETWEDNFYTDNLEDWDIPAVSSPKVRRSSPKLEIDTSVAHTSQTTSWIDTPLSATIISPMSAFSKLNSSSDASPIEISPTDSVVSGKSFFTDSGYSSATTQSATSSSTRFDRFPSIGNRKGKKREFGTVSQAWIETTAFSIPHSISSMVARPDVMEKADSSPNVVHSAGRCTGSSKPTLTSPHWHDAPSLVRAFSESLNAHLKHTKSALQMLPQTPITVELMSMSRTSIFSVGLEVLTGILDGRNPTALVQIFAFTHIACALAIAMEDDEAKIHTHEWFQDSLQWASALRGERQQKGYDTVARVIWQPLESLVYAMPSCAISKENSLAKACMHFLDIFESFGSHQTNVSIAASQFNFAQASFEHRAKICVIDELIKKPRIEAFIEDVVNVERRLHQGQILNTRSLELELIYAGKLASQSDATYSRFLQHVTSLCDVLYAAESLGMSRRGYQVRDISQIKQLMLDDNFDEESEHGDFRHAEEQKTCMSDLYGDDDDDNFLLLDQDFVSTSEEAVAVDKHDVAVFSRDCDEMLGFIDDSQTSVHLESHQYRMVDSSPPTQSRNKNTQRSQPPRINVLPPTPVPPPDSIAPAASSSASISPSPTNTNPPTPWNSSSQHRCHCGYIPSGEEKWKASNLRRHKRVQHAAESKVYVCRWRGCKSSFTRSDNLRCHVREKGHYEGAEGRNGEGGGGRGSGGGATEEEEPTRRKRRRVGEDGNKRV
ncbi:hypothetical protein ONS95_014658 [Cadophora gregata]|uniref:uncharacterized protein n=1 Tax=Cadophora gregata TaxID=51156 RepID=UPI0026DB0337|nr:uncharacterized protein ONS95_014658 [Cadophora gregata]KAK0112940.1 hypothetical protein ONS95_014658 [Cadophora gregata]KAK0125064.1 hypothetical protein ONS96_008932 [Cadophora gregata f. sp. sojae]